jgi:hypothetical protein
MVALKATRRALHWEQQRVIEMVNPKALHLEMRMANHLEKQMEPWMARH